MPTREEKNVGLFQSQDEVRIGSFPNFFSPTVYDTKLKKMRAPATADETDKARFRATVLLVPNSPNHKAAEAAAIAAAKAKWPGLDLKAIKFPFKNGTKLNEKRAKAGQAAKAEENGMVVIYAASKYEPVYGAVVSGKIVDYLTDTAVAANHDKFWGGVNAVVEINFVANGDPDNEGFRPSVTAYLNRVVSAQTGDRLSTRKASGDVFKQYAGRYSDTNPTEGLLQDADEDDSIPY